VLTDPIAALSTAPGRAALAVIRVSGDGALAVVNRVVRSRTGQVVTLETIEPRRPLLVRLVDGDNAPIDQAIVTVFRGPESYTGQDMVELSCHGGLLVPGQVLASLYAAGARVAQPGEFTRRAVLNGKLDLLQAEAVGDLIDASARVQARAAIHQLDGGLSGRLHELRESMLELLALFSYDIDFPEEDEGPVAPERIHHRLEEVTGSVARLLATAPAGERLREGALVVLAGRPNAGKSSLFNALLGSDRALVTEIPGTTRDTIEANTDVVGWPVRLADTAGLRDSDERLERMGIEVSRRYVNAADLLLFCVESGRVVDPGEQEILAAGKSLLVRTKADLVPIAERESEEGIPVSALNGEGLDRLRSEIAGRLFQSGESYADLSPMLTRERHRIALSRADESLRAAKLELGRGGDPVLAAHHVRNAVDALDELIGVVHPDEVLARVFERFCVGK
jgi:tRNA modification GTPase